MMTKQEQMEVLMQSAVVAEAESAMNKAEYRKDVIKDLFQVDPNPDTLDMYVLAVTSYNKAKALYEKVFAEYKALVAKIQQK